MKKKNDATTDNVLESNNVMPKISCQTTVQAMNPEQVGEAVQIKGQE